MTLAGPAGPGRSAGAVSAKVAADAARRRRVLGRVFGRSALAHLLYLGDGAAAACGMAGALLIWSVAADGPFTWSYVTAHGAWFLLVVPWTLLLRPARRPALMWIPWDSAVVAAHTAVVVSLLYALIFFAAPRGLLPRLVVVYFAALAFSLTMAWRFVFIRVAARAWPPNRVVIVGAGAAARIIADILRTRTPHSRVLAFISDRCLERDTTGLPILGVDGLEKLIAERNVSELILAHDGPPTPELAQAIGNARKRRVDVLAMQTVYEQLLQRIPIRHLGADAELGFADAAADDLSSLAKRTLDIVAGIVGCSAVLLLLPLLAPAIWLDVGWPILFFQQRVGLAGRSFQLVKFRTMGNDAERHGPQWATKRDHRVSSFGRFLRRFRLDELPQFWNVLKGEMSLVGPRPERPEFADELERVIPHYAKRCTVRPGLTGWAQTRYSYARSTEDAITKLEYDLYYIRHGNLAFDFLIGLHTVWAILTMGRR